MNHRKTTQGDNKKDHHSSGFMHALNVSEHLLEHAEEMDFQYILNEMTALCGAQFGVMNLFDSDGLSFHTVAVSGASSLLQKGMSLLGFNLFEKKWGPDQSRKTYLENTAITRYDSLSEMAADVIPHGISSLLTVTFHLGDAFLLKVASSTELLGDITMLMRKDDAFAHEEVVTLCLHQIGNALFRYRSEENLIYSRKFAQAILETSKDGFWMLDAANSRILDVNETYCLLSGYERTELLTMKITDLEVEEMPADTMDHLQRIRKNGSDRFQTRHRRKDGIPIDVDVTVTWMDGEKPCFICFCQDITSRLAAEEALRESEVKRNALFTTMSEMVVLHELVCDEQGTPVNYRITDCNIAFSTTTGIARENAIGQLATELYGTEAPPYLKEYAEVVLTGEPSFYETYFLPMDKFYLVSTVSLEKNRFATVTTDITEQKRAEEAVRNARNQFRSLIENIPGITYRCKNDADCTMLFMSSPVETITGYTAAELIGNTAASYASLVHPDDAGRVSDVIASGLAAQQNWEVEYRLQHKDGTLRWVYEKGSAVIENSGPVLFRDGFILDVTGEKLAEIHLQESEERFDRAIAGTGAGLWDWDMVRNTVYFSPQWKSMLGYEDHEVANDFSGWKNLWHPDEAARIEAAMYDFLEGRTTVYEVEHRLLRKDRNWQWILTRGDIAKDAAGKPIRWTGTNIDINDRKQMEQALERERNLFTAGPVFTIEWAPLDGWPVRTVSSNVTAILGYTPEEMKSEGFVYASLIHPEDLERIKPEVVHHIEQHVDAFEQSYRLKTRSGAYRWFYDFTKLVRNEEGMLVSIIGYMYDQTVQKESQDALVAERYRLASIIEGTHAGTWEWNVKTGEAIFNDRWAEIIGYTLEELSPVSIETWMKHAHPDDLKGSEELLNQHFSGELDYYEYESRMRHKNGDWVWILDRGRVVSRSEDGRPVLMMGTHQDITNRKKEEDALRIAKENAESASKAKSQFLANMSHEIRTPLNGVIGFTELLMSTPLSPVQQQYANNAHVSGNMLLGIINDILDFSKIEAGMMNLEIIRTDMFDLLESSVEMIKHAAEKKNLEVLLDMDLSMPRYAMADPVRLQQILGNLLGNAVKFTEKGEVELKVSYEAGSEEMGTFSFSVRDTGIGISKSQIERLFKAFSQADGSTTRRFGGTGLGLVISDLLAQEMGSKIDIDSIPGEGSVFHFSLATVILEEEKKDMPALEGIHRCLIIDDNGNNRKILEHFLARWHIETESCDNGLTALKLLEDARPFDVVICDYHMPYLDGLDTIRLIREKRGHGPEQQTIFLLRASSGDEELLKKSEELGIRFQLTKPVRSRDLYSALSSLHVKQKQSPSPPASLPSPVRIWTESQQVPEQEKVTILVADDVHINMKLIKALIHRLLPHAVLLEAENGLKALELYRESKPDLILMDVQMPGMDGIEAAKTIRMLERGGVAYTPIIALSAGVLKEEQERCLEAGMDDFLAKPLSVDKLKVLVEKWIGRKT